ncbi:MAG: extracellular solute-binding protein, partial [Streptococcus sp.]|nr:extracellular solute-binding protein [Streptococcus sp.]
MKINKMKYLFLAAATLTGLAACSNSTTKSNDEKSDQTNFKITTVRWSDWGEEYHKGFIDDSAKEAGIEISWDTLVAADWTDKKSVLVASGDLPDAFLGSNAFNDAEIAQNQSLFIPLEDLIKENMPNLTKAMEQEPKLKAMITSPDGHIYSLPKKLPMRPTVGNQLFINKKWLDNLGLKVPETYEEFVKVLQAFKDKDANGNGDPTDEIPFGSGNFDPTFSYILPFNNRLGADNTYEMSVKDGKPVYLRTEESYKQGIAAMHDAYKKGLIDPELYTEDSSMSAAKRMDKSVARVGVSSGWTADAT